MATKHDHQKARARTLRNHVQLLAHEAAERVHVALDRDTPDHQVPFGHTYRKALQDCINDLTGRFGVDRREACWQGLMQVTGLNPSEGDLQPSATTRNLTLEMLGGLAADVTRIPDDSVFDRL